MPVDEMYGGNTTATGNDARISEIWPSAFRNPIMNLILPVSPWLKGNGVPMLDFDEIRFTVLGTSI